MAMFGISQKMPIFTAKKSFNSTPFMKINFNEFLAKVKETQTYQSSARKEYCVVNATKTKLSLRDERTGSVVEVNTRDVFAALIDYGTDGCTVAAMKKYVDAKAAPACAALVYSTVGRGTTLQRLNQIADQYLKMTAEERTAYLREQLDKTPDPTYEELLESRHKEDLVADALTFGLPYTDVQLERLSKGALRNLLIDRVRNHTADWIEDLTVADLRLLQQLCQQQGEVLLEGTPLTLLIECLGFLDFSLQPVEGMKFCVHLYEDMRKQFEPYVEEAIAHKLARKEDVMEQVVTGLINTVGTLTAGEMLEKLCRLLFACDSTITRDAITYFFGHSMLLRELGYVFGSDLETSLYSILLDTEDWLPSVRQSVSAYQPTDIKELLARGAFPYLTPYRSCERSFYDLFLQNGKDSDEAGYAFTLFYYRAQQAEYEVNQMIQDVLNALECSSKELISKALPVIINFFNGIPKFYLKGCASEVVAAQSAERPYVAPKKVGRNDPCPCGSGKKYKNCCGSN
jgi:hypothetical protein